MIAPSRRLLRRPINQVSFACIGAIVVAVSVLWWGSASAGGPLRPFKHGFWSGGAYTDDRTGAFSHCSAGVAYDSGISLFLLTTGRQSWWLGFIDPQWSLPLNSKVPVQLRFDNHPSFEQLATIPSGQIALVPLPDSSRLIHAFRRTSKLYLVAEGRSFFFKLRGASVVMDQLTGCVRTSLALETHGAPPATAGTAAPMSEAQIASSGAPRSSKAATAPASSSAVSDGDPRSLLPIATLVTAEAETTSPIPAWVLTIVLGALMGVVGQGIRAIVGLRKERDGAAALGRKFIETFAPRRLLISLSIGAIAGGVAAIVTAPSAPVSWAALLGFGTAGYSGADFVEGVMGQHLFGRTHARYRFSVLVKQGLRRGEKDA